jgi:hypothetical protein
MDIEGLHFSLYCDKVGITHETKHALIHCMISDRCYQCNQHHRTPLAVLAGWPKDDGVLSYM